MRVGTRRMFCRCCWRATKFETFCVEFFAWNFSRADSESRTSDQARHATPQLVILRLQVVILRESGGPSTPQRHGSITDASEYWVARSSRAMTAVGVANGDAPQKPGDDG